MKNLLITLFILVSLFSPSGVRGLFAQSTEIRPGIILPQMATAQRTALSATNGMLVFDTNTQSYWLRSSGAWTELPKTAANTNFWQQTGLAGNEIKNTNSGGFWSANPTGLTSTSDDTSNPPTAPVSGAGTRLMWIPSRSAFRVGTISHDFPFHWDYSNIGLFSFASGFNTIARGKASTAMGDRTTANAESSTVFGSGSIANGALSVAMGQQTNAIGTISTAMGDRTTANGFGSTAMGFLTVANGDYSTAMGMGTIASRSASTALGKYNALNPDAIFMVGNGIHANWRVNAFTVRGDNNFVGIGTDNPVAHLHVASFGYVNTGQSAYFYPNSTTLTSLSTSNANVGIYANQGIVSGTYVGAAQSVTASDIRIKNIINRSDNMADLARLRQLQITNYRMKDEGTWGDKIFKKVIAQEVEKIYPEAVSKQTAVIPDIYALAEKLFFDSTQKELTISMSKFYNLKIGDKIELVHPQKGKIRSTISAVSGNDFTVKDWYEKADKIFVFGREVDDFRVVDYEALSMLGISAIQELAKQNDALKAKNTVLEQRLTNQENRLEKLENLLTKSNN
jgi:hypothetical protein